MQHTLPSISEVLGEERRSLWHVPSTDSFPARATTISSDSSDAREASVSYISSSPRLHRMKPLLLPGKECLVPQSIGSLPRQDIKQHPTNACMNEFRHTYAGPHTSPQLRYAKSPSGRQVQSAPEQALTSPVTRTQEQPVGRHPSLIATRHLSSGNLPYSATCTQLSIDSNEHIGPVDQSSPSNATSFTPLGCQGLESATAHYDGTPTFGVRAKRISKTLDIEGPLNKVRHPTMA